MARTTFDGFEVTSAGSSDAQKTVIELNGEGALQLPADLDFASTDILRDGQDLILRDADGTEVTIDNYFNADPAPSLLSESGGQSLSPQLVQAFVQHDGDIRMANAGGIMSDTSPIGEVTEVTGDAKIIRTDGTEEPVTLGTVVFEGDIVETEGSGAVNIGFIDESSFAVSENARIAIDEFVFDPSTEAGAQDFSVLRGVFMYTSGLIGRENPDSVDIETPVGSIGIRGTIIGGKIDPSGESQITVIEGAIVVRNGGGEQLLSSQFDTVKLSGFDSPMSHVGTLNVQDVANDYGAVKNVSANLFSSFNDQMQEEGPSNGLDESSTGEEAEAGEESSEEAIQEESLEESATETLQTELKSVSDTKSEMKQEMDKARDAVSDTKSSAREAVKDVAQEQQHFRKEILDSATLEFKMGGNVDENAVSGTVVGQVGPTVALPFGLKYSLVNNFGGRFAINPDTGVVSLATNAPDYESVAQNVFNLKIQATRADTGTSRAFDLRVNLNDVNEAATITQTTALTLDEDNGGLINDVVIQTLNINDPDTTNAFRAMNFTVSDNRFDVVRLGGNYRLVAKQGEIFDAETESSVTVTITPNDGVNAYSTLSTTVNINDLIDEAPSDINLDSNMVSENDMGAVIGNLTASDADSGDSHSFSIEEDLSGLFEIDGSQLRLKSGSATNFEANDTHTLTIRATDSNGNVYDKEITVNVSDVNEAGTINIDAPSTDESNIGLSGNRVIQTIDINDPDTNGSFREYSFTVNDARFEVLEIGGEYKLVALSGAVFDHETQESISITVTPSDGVNTYTAINVTVTIDDINEAPTAISVDNVTISENDMGAVIGNLTVTDEDDGDSHSFEIAEDLSGLFEIDGSELRLKSGAQADFETNDTHTITIRVTDAGGNTHEEEITININDANDAATFELGSSTNIIETDNSGLNTDVVVRTIEVTDLDATTTYRNTSFTTNDARFEVLWNNTSGVFEILAKAGEVFDFETENSIDLTITPQDGVNIYDPISVTVNLTDVNETPHSLTLSGNTFDENEDDVVVGILNATDEDVGDTITYSIQSQETADLFVIDGNTLRVNTGQFADYEAKISHTVIVRAQDADGLYVDQTFTINVNNVDEVPTLSFDLADRFDISSNAQGILAMNQAGAIVGEIHYDDPDGDTFALSDFSLDSGKGQYFEIIENGGKFFVKLQDNFEFRQNGGNAQLYNTDTSSFVSGQLMPIGNKWDISIYINDEVEGSLTMGVTTNPNIVHMNGATPVNMVDNGIALGDDGNNVITVTNDDFKLIRGGGGHDKVILSGGANADTYDLFDLRSAVSNLTGNSADLRSVEEIVISNVSNDIYNNVRMNIADVIDLMKTSDSSGTFKITSVAFSNPEHRGKVEFFHEGSETALTDFDADGVNGSDFTYNNTILDSNGHTYHVYNHAGGGQVLIDQNIINADTGGAAL